MESDTEAGTRSASRQARCPLGFSKMQIAILSTLKTYPQVIAYWQIAESINTDFGLAATEGVVRGALERLFPRGFLVRSRAVNGKAQGNRYAFSTDPCPHILSCCRNVESGMESAAQSGGNGPPSILEEKRDRENLSISSGEDENRSAVRRLEALTEDDIAYHWPNLARAGFGTCQIRQIIERLAQVDIGAEKVMQGLTHAEWELETGSMHDKSGAPVSSPVNWVFSSLTRNGYYRRPAGYVSPQEQAELDAAEEAKRVADARKALKENAFDSWQADLSPEERTSIIAPSNCQFPMPEDTALRLHFKKHVWPEILANQKQREGSHDV